MQKSHNEMKNAKLFLNLMLAGIIGMLSISLVSCNKDEERKPPSINMLGGENYTHNGAVAEVGHALTFGIEASGDGANLTNFTVKLRSGEETRTVMDSGMNSPSFTVNKTFYQGVEDTAEWIFTVMDKNRLMATTSIMIYKDPNSTFGGIRHYPSVILGMDQNDQIGQFFSPSTGDVWMEDSASMYPELIDVLVYFKMSEDNGVLLPSPTFSSPGEEGDGVFEIYPYLADWNTRNYTRWDIRADNGVTNSAFDNAHNDSLLIVSYDDVWGKRKYKWAYAGTIIPFMTGGGKKGLVRVLQADTTAGGIIEFEMKIQQ
jgi:hypothetical protein